MGGAKGWSQEITTFSGLDDPRLSPDEFRTKFWAAQGAFLDRCYLTRLGLFLSNGYVEEAVAKGRDLMEYLERLAEWLQEPAPGEVPTPKTPSGETTPTEDAVPEASDETPSSQVHAGVYRVPSLIAAIVKEGF